MRSSRTPHVNSHTGSPSVAGNSTASPNTGSSGQPTSGSRLNGPAGLTTTRTRYIDSPRTATGEMAAGSPTNSTRVDGTAVLSQPESERAADLLRFFQELRDLGAPLRPAVSGANSGLESLPDEVLGAIAAKLSPSERLQLATTSRSVAAALMPDVLGHATMLSGARIAGLPDVEQEAAKRLFIETSDAMRIRRTAVHDELLAVAKDKGVQGLVNREDKLVDKFTILREIGDGDPISKVMARHGLSRADSRLEMEKLAIYVGPAGKAVDAGENALEVARRYGILNPKLVRKLQRSALYPRAYAAVEAGENAQVVAGRHGIDDPELVRLLQERALRYSAYKAVEAGDNAQVVAGRHGIDDPELVRQLQEIALNGPAGKAVNNGKDAQVVAQEYGIVDPELVSKLREAVVTPQVIALVEAGHNVKAIAQQRCFVDDKVKFKLQSLALEGPALRAIAARQDPQQVARRLGIEHPDLVCSLKALALQVPALQAVAAGEDARVVAQRYGIYDPNLIRHLEAWGDRHRSSSRPDF